MLYSLSAAGGRVAPHLASRPASANHTILVKIDHCKNKMLRSLPIALPCTIFKSACASKLPHCGKFLQVWDDYLDWLSANNLLTTKVQSRTPTSDKATSLDGLRSVGGLRQANALVMINSASLQAGGRSAESGMPWMAERWLLSFNCCEAPCSLTHRCL